MPIVIDLQVTGKKADSALDRMERVLQSVADAQDRLNKVLAATAFYASNAAKSFQQMGSSAKRAGTAVRQSATGQTPGQRRMASYYSAIASTNPQAALRYAQGRLAADPYDAQAIRLAQRASRALHAQTPNGALQQAIARTRFTNVAGKMIGHPLGVDVMKIGSMLGPDGVAGLFGGGGGAMAGIGAVAGPFAVATGAVLAFAAAVAKVADMLKNISSQTALAGDKALGLQAAANYFNTDPASLAQRIQSGVSSGVGAGFGVQAGINPVGGPYGDNDYAGKAQKALKYIINSGSRDQARRRAEGLGMPELAGLYDLKGSNRADAARGGMGLSPGALDASRAAGANFSYAWSRIMRDFELVLTKATPIIDYFAKSLADAADMLEFVLNGFKKSDRGSALERNTKALNDAAAAYRDAGTYGGGPRAHGAMPSGIKGAQASSDYNVIHGLKLGAMGR